MVAGNSQILGQALAQRQTRAQVMAMAMATSPPKTTPTSPKQKMITQGHQCTQSLLNLAAARRGHWSALPSPLPEPLTPPPPPTEKRVKVEESRMYITLGLQHPRTRVPTCLPHRPE